MLCEARNDAAAEEAEFGEIHLFGPDFVLSVWHGNAPALRPVRKRLETGPDLLARKR